MGGAHLHRISSQQYSGGVSELSLCRCISRYEEALSELLNSNSASISKSIRAFPKLRPLNSCLGAGAFSANHGELEFGILLEDALYSVMHPQRWLAQRSLFLLAILLTISKREQPLCEITMKQPPPHSLG